MSNKKVKIAVKSFLKASLLILSHETISVFGSFLVFYIIIKFTYIKSLSIDALAVFGAIWLLSSMLGGLINFFIDLNRHIHKGISLTPVIPSIISGIIFILFEVLIFIFIQISLNRFFALSNLSLLFVFAFTVLSFEIIRRRSIVFVGLQRTFLKISIFVKQAGGSLGKSWLNIVYWLLSFGFAGLSFFLLYKGYISPKDNLPDSANELFSNVLTIVVGILAIFFAAATLVVQLIIGAYSYKFVKVLFRTPMFLSSFLIYLFIGIVHLICLRIGWNSYLADYSLVSSIYILTSLIVLVSHFADWVQVPYVIEIATKDSQKYINKSKKPKLRIGQFEGKTRSPSLKYTIRSYFLTAFLGENYKDPYLEELAESYFPEHTQKRVIEDIRPLLTTCLKAINEDKREVVLACLDGVNKITKAYIEKFGDSIFSTDNFFMFLYDQLSIIYESAIESKNQQFTLDIVETVVAIGKNCLILTRNTRENSNIFIWIEFLQESTIKSLHLQRTGAQMTACTGIIDIGNSLIKQNAYPTALNIVAPALYKIGQTVARIKHMWTAAIAIRVTSGLLELLANYTIVAWQSDIHDQFFVGDICKKIFNVLDLAYKNQRSDFLTITRISNSVVQKNGGLNITGVASIVLAHWPDQPSHTQHILLSEVRELIFLVNRLSQSATSVKGYAVEDYCATLSEIGYMLIKFIAACKEKQTSDLVKKDLKLVLDFAESMVETAVHNQENSTYESLSELSFLYASLLYYSNESEGDFFLSLYSNSLKKLGGLINTSSKAELENRGYRTLYSYIKLFSAWLFHFDSKHQMNKFLKLLLRRNAFLSFFLEKSDYPDYFVSDDWNTFGLNVWRSRNEEILKFFRNREIYFSFDKHLSNKRKAI